MMFDVTMQDGYRTTLAASSENEVIKIICRWFKCSKNDIKNIYCRKGCGRI